MLWPRRRKKTKVGQLGHACGHFCGGIVIKKRRSFSLIIKVQTAKEQAEVIKRKHNSCTKEMIQLYKEHIKAKAFCETLLETGEGGCKKVENNLYIRDVC